MTASVLLVNMLFCLSGDVVVEALDCDEFPDTKVFSLSASEVIGTPFFISFGVGGLETE